MRIGETGRRPNRDARMTSSSDAAAMATMDSERGG
jgi:hypothetical protein